MKRRTVLAGLGTAGLASVAGCLDLLGMAEHESSPAGVVGDVRDETGYQQTAVDDIVIEEDVAGSESIEVTNYMTKHEKAVDMGPLGSQRGAIFIVLTTPQITIAGRNLNPVEEMSATELVELVENNYDEIDDITHEEDAEIEILEETTTRSRFTAEATFNGHDLEVDLHVSEAVEADDDLLVTLGVYPERLRGREAENVLALMEGVTTDVDADESTDPDGENGGNGGSDGNETGENDGEGEGDDDGVLGRFE